MSFWIDKQKTWDNHSISLHFIIFHQPSSIHRITNSNPPQIHSDPTEQTKNPSKNLKTRLSIFPRIHGSTLANGPHHHPSPPPNPNPKSNDVKQPKATHTTPPTAPPKPLNPHQTEHHTRPDPDAITGF